VAERAGELVDLEVIKGGKQQGSPF
jgi:hypothetical protein